MKTLKILLLIISILLLAIIITHKYISYQASDHLYDSTATIPKNKVGLLLGTSKYAEGGAINRFYKHRIDAAVALYKAGKIDFILVSGDNGSKSYDEPSTFKEDLVLLGVPEDRIYLDFAGFRTLDSVVRAKEIFGQTQITIISQKFHNERAIYLAKNRHIDAIGYNAKEVKAKYSIKTYLREYLARVKASIDLVFNKQPKYLGDKIEIN